MNDNYLRQLCGSIDGGYWERYIDDYNHYGDAAQTTRKRFEEWQVAADVTRQILDALEATRDESDSDLFRELGDLIQDVNPEEIADHIKHISLDRWSKGWRQAASIALNKLRMPEKKGE